MEIVNPQEFNTQAGNLGTRYTLKNKAKNILIKLSDVTISQLDMNKLAIRVTDEASLNVLNQFEEKLSNFLVSHFNTSNETISPIIYTSEAGNKSGAFASASANHSVYVRLNNYSSFYDITGEDYELENRRITGDCILKFDTITFVNSKYYVNSSMYQCLVKDVIEGNNSKLLLSDVEFMNNF